MNDSSQDGLPNLSLVNQLQAIANVSRHLQNMYQPNMTSAVYPSTSSPAFDPSRGGQHQQQQQLAAAFPLAGFTGPQLGSGHSSHLLFDDKYNKSNGAVNQTFYQQLQSHQPSVQHQQAQQHHLSAMQSFSSTSPALSGFSPSPPPFSHPFIGDTLSGGGDMYHHPSAVARHGSAISHRANGGGSGGLSVNSHSSIGRPSAAPPL